MNPYGKSSTLAERIVRAAIEWEENDSDHEKDCGCRRCVLLARLVRQWKRANPRPAPRKD